MKIIVTIAAMLAVTLFLFGMSKCTYVSQGEKAFFYNVTSGKGVNANDCPLLPNGFNMQFGPNTELFKVNGTLIDYDFTAKASGSSEYDETIAWNSSEGVVMDTEYKLYGRVSDPWEFFMHFGHPTHSYKVKGDMDERVYLALRCSGRVIAEYINEFTCTTDAEAIRINPNEMKKAVLLRVQTYMKTFGFEITDMMFLKNFTYPEGNVIVDARAQLTDINSEIRVQAQQLKNTEEQTSVNVGSAKIAADTKIAAAMRDAAKIDAESEAMANALKKQIDQIGVEGALTLRSADLVSELTKSGTLGVIVLNEDSILAKPFYPRVNKGKGSEAASSSPAATNKQ